MTDIVDHDGTTLFVDDFTHTTHDADGTSVDVVQTNGNLWFSGPDVMMAMGFQEEGPGGGYARRLSRIDHPDIIKIADTPFIHATLRTARLRTVTVAQRSSGRGMGSSGLLPNQLTTLSSFVTQAPSTGQPSWPSKASPCNSGWSRASRCGA